jgi:DNA-binding response OmpR family regulator
MTVTEFDSPHRLRARIEMLEEQITQLKQELAPDWDPPSELGLTFSQTRMVACLLAHDRVCSERMLWEASRKAHDFRWVTGSNVVSVQMCNLRKKLSPFDLEIETHKGRGFRLTADTRRRLKNWNSQAVAA